MFTKLFVIFAAVYCIKGSPLKPSKILDYDPKYFHSSRIVGGVDAPEGYGEHMAALVFGYYWTHFLCGGSIVTKRHVLTAAHCIDSVLSWTDELYPSFRAIIGTNKWSTGTKEIKFKGHLMHENWNWFTIKYDIGVLTASEDMSGKSVSIVPLKFDWVDGGEKSYVTGWGQLGSELGIPSKLQLLYMETISHKQCEEGIRWAVENLGSAPPVQANIEICALHSPGCVMYGDSGSGLITKNSQEQIGIVSWGFPCARGVPDVFVRISGFRDWLEPIISEHLSN